MLLVGEMGTGKARSSRRRRAMQSSKVTRRRRAVHHLPPARGIYMLDFPGEKD